MVRSLTLKVRQHVTREPMFLMRQMDNLTLHKESAWDPTRVLCGLGTSQTSKIASQMCTSDLAMFSFIEKFRGVSPSSNTSLEAIG